MKNKRAYRKTFQYKIKMWFSHLTFQDIEKATIISIKFIIDILMCILGFILVFILPAFFH